MSKLTFDFIAGSNERTQTLPRVAIISTYLPKQCGLATFASDVRKSLGDERTVIVAVDDEERDFPEEVVLVVDKHDRDSYRRAAGTINSHWDVLDIQHEYGIFGGPDGEYILDLVKNLSVPAIVTLHTVLQRPSEGQQRVLSHLCRLCARVVVMSDRAAAIAKTIYGVAGEKIDVIPHGVPDCEGVAPAPEMTAFGNDPKLFTFGLLSPGKGIAVGIDAVAEIKKTTPNVRYFVLGATHPELKRREGEAYRESLQQRIDHHGLQENVFLIDEYTTLDRLCGFLAGADIYVTPYTGRDQICSGTLSYALGFGLPVVTTPFVYAEELAEKGGGLLFPFGDSAKLAEIVNRLIGDPKFRGRMRAGAATLGRTMRWPIVGQSLQASFGNAIASQEDARVRQLLGSASGLKGVAVI